MREQDAVFLFTLPLMLLLYVLISSQMLPTVMPSARIPSPVRRVVERLGRGTLTFRRALFMYLLWTAFTQVAPVLVALSATTPTGLRVASVIELALATAWTGFLLTRN
jgi:hypothetical protein